MSIVTIGNALGGGGYPAIATNSDLPLTGTERQIYYVIDENSLYGWDGSTWIPLNSTTGAFSINGLNQAVQTLEFDTATTETEPTINDEVDGSTARHKIILPLATDASVTAGLLSNADYADIIGRVSTLESGWSAENILYVGKHGNDSNDGKSLEKAFLTIGAAITAASGETPASDNRFKIEIVDAGNYTENLSIPEWVGVIGLAALINGNHTVADNTAFWAFRLLSSSGNCITKSTGAGNSLIRAERMILTNGANGTLVTSGELIFECGVVEVENGFGFGSLSTGNQHIIVDQIDISGSGIGAGVSGAGAMCVRVNCMRDAGGGTGLLAASGATVNAIVNSINCNTAINEGTGTTLNLICASITGTETRAGSGKTVKADNVALLNDATFTEFPITPSQAPTEDYQVANKKYVSDLETVTKTGANCLTFNGTNNYIDTGKTVAQLGIDFEDAFSMAISFKTGAALVADQFIFGNQGTVAAAGVYLKINSSGALSFQFSQNSTTARAYYLLDTVLTVNTEYNMVITYSGSPVNGSLKIFINGTESSTTYGVVGTVPTATCSPSDNIAVGAQNIAGTANYFLNGLLYNFCIYPKVLNSSEIDRIANGEVVENPTVSFPLSEGSGNIAYDVSGNDNHAEIKGTLTNVWNNTQDIFHYNNDYGCSKYMYFDGVDDYISIGNPTELQITGSLRIEGRITTTFTGVGFVVCKDNGTLRSYMIQIDAGVLKFYIFKSGSAFSVASTTLVNDGKDHSFKCVNDEVDLKIYIDDVLENTNTGGGGTIDNDAADLEIGRLGNNTAFMSGIVHDVKIFNSVTSEIPVAYYSGSEESTWTDLSGNGNDGTVNGTPTSIYIPALLDNSAIANAADGTILNPANAGGLVENGSETSLVTTRVNSEYNFKKIEVTEAFIPPKMTTTQRDAIAIPVAGMVIYNTTTNVLNFYNGTSWGAV